MSRILFCSPIPCTRELGGSKVIVELADEMSSLGWDCEIVSPQNFSQPDGNTEPYEVFHEHLRSYLTKKAKDFDVVDYDHAYLPFSRNEFYSKSLFVARSVLLTHHLRKIKIPEPLSTKSLAGSIIHYRSRTRRRDYWFDRAQRTINEADIVNVSNDDDKVELCKHNIDSAKIVTIPYGISGLRRSLFDQIATTPPSNPVVAFVGTFDYRKGARDFPTIVDEILDHVPAVRFRLLGAAGMFRTEEEILSKFPRRQRDKIEIVMKYKSEELPEYLSDCTVGVFPSYVEGFGFGVLEMLSSSIPVFAYDAPGPPMMLDPEYLVTKGNARELGRRVVSLLLNEGRLIDARVWAKQRSHQFSWRRSAEMTSKVYQEHLCRKRDI